MSQDKHKTDEVEETSQDGISRRGLLKAGMMAAGGAAALSGASMPFFSGAAKAEVGLGPPRKIMWVTHSQAEWNLPLDVGFSDFCAQAGWEYQKIGVPGGAWTVEDNVNGVKLAIQAKPDVLVGTVIDPAMEAIYEEAEAAGILILINNSHIPDVQARHVNWGFIGASGHAQGLIVGRKLIPDLIARGRTGGKLMFGNTEPGHAVLEDRRRGVADAAQEFNDSQGTTFEVEEFADFAHDMAQSVAALLDRHASSGRRPSRRSPSAATPAWSRRSACWSRPGSRRAKSLSPVRTSDPTSLRASRRVTSPSPSGRSSTIRAICPARWAGPGSNGATCRRS